MTIYSCITGKNFYEIEKEFNSVSYRDFKEVIGESVAKKLLPIQNNFFKIIRDKEHLEKCYRENAEKAYYISNKTLNNVKKKLGL